MWYEHSPEGVVETGEVKILWNVNIQCEHLTEEGRPDIFVANKNKKMMKENALSLTMLCQEDNRTGNKEKEKAEKLEDLKKEIKRIWKMRSVW